MLFSPQSVEEVVFGGFPQINEYEIIVTKESAMDEITLRVEGDSTIGVDGQVRIGETLRQQLKAKTNLRFELEWAEPGTLPRYTLKAKRFKDLRS